MSLIPFPVGVGITGMLDLAYEFEILLPMYATNVTACCYFFLIVHLKFYSDQNRLHRS